MVSREEGARLAWEELSDPVYDEARPSLLDLFFRWVDRLLGELLGAAQTALPGGWWTWERCSSSSLCSSLRSCGTSAPAALLRRAAVLDSAGTLSTDEQRPSPTSMRPAAPTPKRSGNGSARWSATWKTTPYSPAAGAYRHRMGGGDLRGLPDQRTELHRVAALFNDVWYGDREATAEGYRLVCVG